MKYRERLLRHLLAMAQHEDDPHDVDCASLMPWSGGMRAIGADACNCTRVEEIESVEYEDGTDDRSSACLSVRFGNGHELRIVVQTTVLDELWSEKDG